jgi:hypothetical protein
MIVLYLALNLIEFFVGFYFSMPYYYREEIITFHAYIIFL